MWHYVVWQKYTAFIFRLNEQACCCLSLSWLTLGPSQWRRYIPPKCWHALLIGLHDVTSLKIVLVMIPTRWWCFSTCHPSGGRPGVYSQHGWWRPPCPLWTQSHAQHRTDPSSASPLPQPACPWWHHYGSGSVAEMQLHLLTSLPLMMSNLQKTTDKLKWCHLYGKTLQHLCYYEFQNMTVAAGRTYCHLKDTSVLMDKGDIHRVAIK